MRRFVLGFQICTRPRTVGTPVTRCPPHRPGRAVFPHTVPRSDSHSRGPSQLPVTRSSCFPSSEVGSCLSSPTCPARVSFEAYFVLPSGPSPCGRLSRPLTMPDKTPRQHIAALRRPTWFSRSITGLPEFYGVSLPACHGLRTPVGLHILAINGCFCVVFGER